jgi:hypothetical protein
LVHRTNQLPERLRTWLTLIRQLATHLAHWEASCSLHSPRSPTILSGRFYTGGSIVTTLGLSPSRQAQCWFDCKRQRKHTLDGLSSQPASTRRGGLIQQAIEKGSNGQLT